MTNPATQPFYMDPRAAIKQRRRVAMRPVAYMVMEHIKSKVFNPNDNKGVEIPNAEFMKECGISKSSTINALRDLEVRNFIHIESDAFGHGRKIFLGPSSKGAAVTYSNSGLAPTPEVMKEAKSGQFFLTFDELPQDAAVPTVAPTAVPGSNVLKFDFRAKLQDHSLTRGVHGPRTYTPPVHDRTPYTPPYIPPKPEIPTPSPVGVSPLRTKTEELKTTAVIRESRIENKPEPPAQAVVSAPAAPLSDTAALQKRKRQEIELQRKLKGERPAKPAAPLGNLLSSLITPKEFEEIFQHLGKCVQRCGLTSEETKDLLKVLRGIAPQIETSYAWRVLAWVCNIRRIRGGGKKCIQRPVGWIKSNLGREPYDCDLKAAKGEWCR